MEKYISDIDSKRFGIKVAKINQFKNDPLELLKNAKAQGIDLIMSRVPISEIALINTLEKIGFRLKDVQLTYNSNLAIIPEQTENMEFLLRDALSTDAEQISLIAEQAFQHYGHYYADERLRNETSSIYKEWALKSCSNKDIADKIIVAELEGEVIGFLTFKIQENANGTFAIGGIGAVSPKSHKMGVFRAINIEGMKWCKSAGIGRVEHNVLTTNFPVNSTYSKLGFTVIRSEATLHCWVND